MGLLDKVKNIVDNPQKKIKPPDIRYQDGSMRIDNLLYPPLFCTL